MNDKTTIRDLLNRFVELHPYYTWKIQSCYNDGKGTFINQIRLIHKAKNRHVGIFTYDALTGQVLFYSFKELEEGNKVNIVDLLLDVINYSNDHNIHA